MKPPPRRLVTGAPGWLGTRLVETLVEGLPEVPELARPDGAPVRCLVQPGADASRLRELGAEVVEGDLRTGEGLEPFFARSGGSVLFHCAGLIHPGGRVRHLFEVNVGGTRRVAEAALRAGVRRMVHVSSNSPLGCNPSTDHVFDEDAPYRPYMTYGRTKMEAEQVVREAGEQGGLEVVIVRPPWFYGPGQPERQARFFTMVRTGRFPVLGGGENRRSMAYVDNTCQGLMLCERRAAAAGRTYWIADARPYSMNEIVSTVERVMERDFGLEVSHRRRRLPGLVGDLARLADAGLQALGLYQQEIHVLSEMNQTIACTVERARRELGYDPKVELEEGMRRSIRWMLDNGQSP